MRRRDLGWLETGCDCDGCSPSRQRMADASRPYAPVPFPDRSLIVPRSFPVSFPVRVKNPAALAHQTAPCLARRPTFSGPHSSRDAKFPENFPVHGDFVTETGFARICAHRHRPRRSEAASPDGPISTGNADDFATGTRPRGATLCFHSISLVSLYGAFAGRLRYLSAADPTVGLSCPPV